MKKYKIGIQLFSVRDALAEDFEGTLKKIADMGYDCVEFAGYYDHTAKEIKDICNKYGLEIFSTHQTIDPYLSDPEKTLEYAKELGLKYSAIPYIGAKRWEEDFDGIINEIKQVGELLHKNGIKQMYHNHDFELLIEHNGKLVLDAIYDELPSDVLIPQLDLCWVSYADQDPVEYIKRYGDVEEVVHFKDYECTNKAAGAVYQLIDNKGKVDKVKNKEEDGFRFKPVGYGVQDFKAILEAMEDTKIEYIVVEQDQHPERGCLEDAKMSIEYLKTVIC